MISVTEVIMLIYAAPNDVSIH